MRRHIGISVIVLIIGGISWGENLAPNGGFEEGTDGPAGWKLIGGKGSWDGGRQLKGLSVTGTGRDSSYWATEATGLESGKAYRFSFWAKTTGSGGCVMSGPDSNNRDYQPGAPWARYSFVFTPKKDPRGGILRLGQWERNDTTSFDDVSVTKVTALYDREGAIELGAGESIRGGVYSFDPDFSYEGSNVSRALAEFTCGFNSYRWTFGPGEWLVYRHRIGGLTQDAQAVRVNVGYHLSGACIVEGSVNGTDWRELGTVEKVDTQSFSLPKELGNASEVWIRLRASGDDPQHNRKPGSFQIYGYTYTAKLKEPVEDFNGRTRFIDLVQEPGPIRVKLISLGDLIPAEGQAVRLEIVNTSPQAATLIATLGMEPVDVSKANETQKTIAAAANSKALVELGYRLANAGSYKLTVGVKEKDKSLYQGQTEFLVSNLYDSGFGYAGGSSGPLNWWWCEGTYKVSRQRPIPTGPPQPVAIAACRGEYEPVQIVLRPRDSIKRAIVSVEGNDRIKTGSIQVMSLAYHFVHRASDDSGCIGWWPDALPEWNGPVDLAAGENQPIWVLVKIPQDCPAGVSTIQLNIQAANLPVVSIPVRVRVYDFEMPRQSHVESAFGVSPGNIRRYHNLQTDDEERAVWDLYMQNFREHRMAPYHFAPYDPIGVSWSGLTWEGGQIVESNVASGTKCLKVEDNSTRSAVNSTFTRLVPVEKGKSIRLQFKARTEKAGQSYLVTLNTYDKNRQWISGHNIDLPQTGDGQWQSKDLRVVPSELSPDATFVRLTVWAAPYSDAGEATGTVWFDDLSLKMEGSDTEWITNGGFEQSDTMTAELDFAAWDRQAEKCLNGYGFTSFMLPLQGTGGGTYESRSPGKIGPFEQGSDGYRKAFASYCGAIQQHLQDKGWLGREYIYWFDEPEPKDYAFVRAGMDEIRRAGPKLRRMLTEEPIEPLLGAVDLWCPILDQFDPTITQSRQAKGETIWWYVCTGPRAPYPGLFIDHSAIDLRMWLWMTWKWKVQGILVWESTYWTSDKAFPAPKMQNPWTDPMGYIGGYSFEPGFVGYWGNGDGRFLYPPNQDVANDKSKHLSGPVSSIRWEMLREGLEDYEYFWLLREAITKAEKAGKSAELLSKARKLLDIGPEIITDKTNFSRDPRPLYERRALIAEMIERLNGKP